MSDEEYIFEEDYDQEYGDGDEELEGAENTYQEAKTVYESDPAAAIDLYKQMLEEDSDKGYWTWKAYKNLAKCHHKTGNYDQMITDFRNMLRTNYADRGRADYEKAVTKFIDRVNNNISDDVAIKFYSMIVEEVIPERRSYEKIWFTLKMKICHISFARKEYDSLQKDLAELTAFCYEGEHAESRKGSQLLTVVALEIQLMTEINNIQRLRELYNLANTVKSAILPPREMGIIKESGGKMFMRQSLWQEAFEAFGQAFRSFDEAGHPRRISCLKYLVLASMLSGSKINPFDTNEARSYQNDPEIVAMTDLIKACDNNDITAFDRVLKDKKNARAILEDQFLYSFLEPLIRKIRCKVLQVLSKPYRTLKLTYIAQELMISDKEAEALVVSMILDGSLKGSIDQLQGVIKLDQADGAGGDRYRHLNRWVSQQKMLQETISNRCASLVL